MTTLSRDAMVYLILAVVGLIFLIGIHGYLTATVDAQTAKQACKLHIQKTVFLNTATPVFNPFEIECPRRIVLLEDAKAKIFTSTLHKDHGKINEYNYNIKTESGVTARRIDKDKLQETFQEAVAYEMAECWDMMGHGSQDVFNDFAEVVPRTVCMVCSEIHMQSGEPIAISAQEILSQEHHILKEPANRYSTVDDYLYGMPNQANANWCQQEGYVTFKDQQLDENNPLAVVYYRQSTLGNDWGAGDSCQAVSLVPIKELPTECYGGVF